MFPAAAARSPNGTRAYPGTSWAQRLRWYFAASCRGGQLPPCSRRTRRRRSIKSVRHSWRCCEVLSQRAASDGSASLLLRRSCTSKPARRDLGCCASLACGSVEEGPSREAYRNRFTDNVHSPRMESGGRARKHQIHRQNRGSSLPRDRFVRYSPVPIPRS